LLRYTYIACLFKNVKNFLIPKCVENVSVPQINIGSSIFIEMKYKISNKYSRS